MSTTWAVYLNAKEVAFLEANGVSDLVPVETKGVFQVFHFTPDELRSHMNTIDSLSNVPQDALDQSDISSLYISYSTAYSHYEDYLGLN